DYQVRALKNDALVFQQWVALRPDVQQKVRVRFEEGWVQLFNSWDLTGWVAPDRGLWKVRDDFLAVGGPPGVPYATTSTYKDFHLRAECWVGEGQIGGLALRLESPQCLNNGYLVRFGSRN